MEVFLQNLMHLSFTASFLMLAVFALRPILKRAPKWIACLLWALVALRLLCPFSLESAVSLVPRAETVTQTVAQSAAMQGTAQQTVATAAPSLSAGNLAFTIWVSGAAAMLLYAAISYVRLYRQLRVHLHDSGNVYLCDGLQTPFILGIFRPRIFLPSGVTEPQKTYILHHEYAHLARGDQFWKPLGFAILSIYWFHPLVWVSYILFCKDIELACDERVVRNLSLQEKKVYSETLLLCSVRRKSVAACPLSFAEVGVKTRVKSVLRYKKPLVSVVVLSCIAVLAVAVCFLTEPKTQEAPVAEPSAEPVAAIAVPVTEPMTEPVTEPVTEPATEAATEPVTEEATATEATTKKKTAKTTTTQAMTTEETTESNKPIVLPVEPPEYVPPTFSNNTPTYSHGNPNSGNPFISSSNIVNGPPYGTVVENPSPDGFRWDYAMP